MAGNEADFSAALTTRFASTTTRRTLPLPIREFGIDLGVGQARCCRTGSGLQQDFHEAAASKGVPPGNRRSENESRHELPNLAQPVLVAQGGGSFGRYRHGDANGRAHEFSIMRCVIPTPAS